MFSVCQLVHTENLLKPDKWEDKEMAEKDKSAAPAAEEGSLFEAVEVEGVLIPKVFERSRPMTEHVEAVRAMQMRDDDVIVCAYSKSGRQKLVVVSWMLDVLQEAKCTSGTDLLTQ